MPRLDQLLARNTQFSRGEVKRLLKAGAITSPSGEWLDDRIELADLPMTVRILDQDVVLHDVSVVSRGRTLKGDIDVVPHGDGLTVREHATTDGWQTGSWTPQVWRMAV